MDCFILSNERMNKNKEAAIIDGPEAVLNSKDVNSPIIQIASHQLLKKEPFVVDYLKYFLPLQLV